MNGQELEEKLAALEKDNRRLRRENSRLKQDLIMLSTLNNCAARLRNSNEKRLYEADMAKSNFLANMSHEIRTPMNAILGMNEMILRESKNRNVLKYAGNLRSAGRTLLALINDILDISRIEAGRFEICPVEYNLASVLQDVVNMTRRRALEQGLSYQMQAAPDMPCRLRGDDVRVRQVMLNLINNAIKYTKQGGVHIYLDYDKAESMLRIQVKDTGIGIKAENMDNLFKAFIRLEETRNRNIEGTGLGLRITSQLVEMMGGKIDVESIYGEGSTFTVSLKQDTVEAEAMGDFSLAISNARPMENNYAPRLLAPEAYVLLVDDNELNREVFCSLLAETKVRIKTVASGQECLKLLRSGAKFDLIIMDQMMPQLSGAEVLELIRFEGLAKDVPVIVMTADAVGGARERYLKEGFTDYLAKPVIPQALEQMLIDHLPEGLRTVTEKVVEEGCVLPRMVVVADSSEKLHSLKESLDNMVKGVYLRNTDKALKYMNTHEVDYLMVERRLCHEIISGIHNGD